MLKRKRKYYCKYCKRTVTRISDKQWIRSMCGINDDKIVRLTLKGKG